MLSLRLAMAMACTLFGLTPLEAVVGATANAAKALGLADRGRLVPGLRAVLALWGISHPAALAYWLGGAGALEVFSAGVPLRHRGNGNGRSEGRRVGKECGRKGRARWWPAPQKKNDVRHIETHEEETVIMK